MKLIHLQIKAKPDVWVEWARCGEKVDRRLQKVFRSWCNSYVVYSEMKKAENGRGA